MSTAQHMFLFAIDRGFAAIAADNHLRPLLWDINTVGVSTEIVGRTPEWMDRSTALSLLREWSAAVGLYELEDDDENHMGYGATFGNITLFLPTPES